jgi:hypothetical protein
MRSHGLVRCKDLTTILESDRPDDDLTNEPKLVATLYNYLCTDGAVEENICCL